MSNKHLSYHIIVDKMSKNDIDQIVTHLVNLNLDYVNVKGGERFDLAMYFVEQMYSKCPQTKVILRRWPDDGILKRYNYDSQKWFDTIINPLLDWLLKYKPIWLVDNESLEADLRPYAKCSAEIIEMMGKLKLGVGVGRFAAGNPKENQYGQLDQMWLALKKYWHLSIWTPNEYFEKANKTSGNGSVFRYHLAWQHCKNTFNFIPKTVIGEFGLAVNYLSDKGYKTLGLDERSYYDLCQHYFRIFYAPCDVTVCLFSIGNWNGFEVSEAFMAQNETNIDVNVIEKPYVGQEIASYVTAIDNGIRVREKAVTGKVIGHVQKHQTLLLLDDKSLVGKSNTWIKVQFNNKIGYVASWYFVRASCANDNFIVQELENNMNTVLSALLEIARSVFTSRTLMIPLIGGILAIIINANPNLGLDPAVWTERIFALILLLSGTNEATKMLHAAKGKTYNRQTKSWE